MQEILIVLCGVAGVAAAALIRRGRRAAGSALRSERNVLERTVSLLERDPTYASERQELLHTYRARLKEVEQAIAKSGRMSYSASAPREQDAVVDDPNAPEYAGLDGDAEVAGDAGESGAAPVAAPAIHTEAAAVPGTPDVPEPPEAGGESGADSMVPAIHTEAAAVPGTPDVPEPPEAGGKPDAKASPDSKTPDTPEVGPEAGDTKTPYEEDPAGPHASTAQLDSAGAAGGTDGRTRRNTPGEGPDSAEDAERLPDTPPATPPKTPTVETPTHGMAGTGISGDAPPAIDPKDIHDDASGRPGVDQGEGDGPAPPDPDGDDSEDLEKIKADIIKTLNRLQRAEDD